MMVLLFFLCSFSHSMWINMGGPIFEVSFWLQTKADFGGRCLCISGVPTLLSCFFWAVRAR
jgi:hypothetical protein